MDTEKAKTLRKERLAALIPLKEAAVAATAGPYRECGATKHDGGCQCGLVWSMAMDYPVLTASKANDEGPGPSQGQAKRNANFFAMVSPEVVTRLIATIETLEAEVAKYEYGVEIREICDKNTEAARRAALRTDVL